MKTIYEKDKDVLIGATIVDVSPDDKEHALISHIVLKTLDGRIFTATGWEYDEDDCPLVLKEGIHLKGSGNDFEQEKGYE